MSGSRLPIAVAHGEGYANFKHRGHAAQALGAMRFVDNTGAATEQYPFNPNGSVGGLTAVTTADGRFTAMMPHPERVFRNVQMSWTNGDVSASSPWMRIWQNAASGGVTGEADAPAVHRRHRRRLDFADGVLTPSAPEASGAQTGAWGAADAYSDEVQEAARFAVQKQAVATRSRLIFKDVQSAQVQVVAGLNFRMKLVVVNDGVSQNAVATVWRNLENQYQLTEWQWSID